MTVEQKDSASLGLNRDPITGTPGAHPVGTGVGAAVGGAAVGAAAGAVAGPVGVAVGTIAGAVAGGLAGKAAAESINPTTEEAFWREHYAARPYYSREIAYDRYAPAYRYGWESRAKFVDQGFDEVEPELRRGWDNSKHEARLEWNKAKQAVRDAWERSGGLA
ncbi:MAG: hypothetical protein NT069_23690 [Planctomycetota bacterium]|nr:hypothetical protein [Planctomycetota bacterium]